MTIWLTADHHFGHTNIIKYCDRPFGDVWEMNCALSRSWKELVHPEDFVLHLGDVTLIKDTTQYLNTVDLIKALPGKIALIAGNHDRKGMLAAYREWGWKVLKPFSIGALSFSHRPEMKNGTRSIHGHCHSKLNNSSHVDIGVDASPTFAPFDSVSILGEQNSNELLDYLNQTRKGICLPD